MYRTAEVLYQGYYDRHGVLVRDRRSWMVSRFVEQLLRGEPVTRAQWDRYGAAGGRPEFLFETVNKLAASSCVKVLQATSFNAFKLKPPSAPNLARHSSKSATRRRYA